MIHCCTGFAGRSFSEGLAQGAEYKTILFWVKNLSNNNNQDHCCPVKTSDSRQGYLGI